MVDFYKQSTILNDVMNVEHIKNSKLFKKFLESEQSEGNNSGSISNRGFQESPFRNQYSFPEKELENALQASRNMAQSQKISDNYRSQIPNYKGGRSQSPNRSGSIQNLTISSGSEQSRAYGSHQHNPKQSSHSYFQPPQPNYNVNSTQQTNTLSHSPDNSSNVLNISQRVLDNQRKQQFSPERFYFNGPSVPQKPSNHTIVEEDTIPPTLAHTSNNSQHTFNDQINSNKMSSLKKTGQQSNQSIQQHPAQYYQQSYQIQQYQPQYQSPLGYQGFQNSQSMGNIGTYNQGVYQPGDYEKVKEREQDTNNNSQNTSQQIYAQEGNQESVDNNRENTSKKTGKNYNFSKNSKSTLLNTSGDPKRLNFQSILQQMQDQEEQVAQIHLSLEQEQLKNQVLKDTLSIIRNQVTSLEADKAEIRTQLLAETEANAREVQSTNQKNYTLKNNVSELEAREEMLRADLEKYKQASFKEELARQRLEDELKEAKNKIREQQESQDLSNERNSEKLSETQRQQFKEVEEKEESVRKIVENERLKNEVYSTSRQLHDAQLRVELLSTDLNNCKQQLLEKSQKENTLQLQLDKATIDAFQIRTLFQRAESELNEIKQNSLYSRPSQIPIDGYSLPDQVQSQYTSESDGRNQIGAYKRGRLSSEQEEEVNMNHSYSRTRFKPQDNNIFGTSRVDDTYQQNPMKIGSVSPNRMPGNTRSASISDLPPAGMRRQPNQFGGNPISGGNQGRNNAEVLEKNIQLMNQDRKFLEDELKKLEDMKRKSGADIRRKGEVNRELEQLEKQIAQQKMQLKMMQ